MEGARNDQEPLGTRSKHKIVCRGVQCRCGFIDWCAALVAPFGHVVNIQIRDDQCRLVLLSEPVRFMLSRTNDMIILKTSPGILTWPCHLRSVQEKDGCPKLMLMPFPV